MSTGDADRLALERFLLQNPEFDKMEALLRQFNLFESLGVVRQELRHSDFLRFLLDPNELHGVGDRFLKRFLQSALSETNRPDEWSALQVELWDLRDAAVAREWHSIDVLVTSERERVAIILENKIASSQHSDQLRRYVTTVEERYRGWKILGLYLTPDGREPSNERFIAVGYDSLNDAVERVLEGTGVALQPDVRVAISHYVQMLRRHIVTDSEIATLCRKIYHQHRHALDLLFEHRPDQQTIIRDAVVECIRSTPGIHLDKTGKSNIDFFPTAWDLPRLREGTGWTKSGHMLMFEVLNSPTQVSLCLYLGPGPEATRSRLFAKMKSRPFKPSFTTLKQSWNTVWRRSLLRKEAYERLDTDGLGIELRKQWREFVETDLPPLVAALRDEDWLRKATVEHAGLQTNESSL
ncbi:MAG: hypothetical protein EPO26_17495 [Chloroflexota bacterium]|nr:MAG: hypothetical protein EPO26_17495 [Chloroflexota bacterium]